MEPAIGGYFLAWRRFTLGGREVLEGMVGDEHAHPSSALARELSRWPGYHYWVSRRDGKWLVLVREFARTRERWWLHALLFVATLVTASVAGAEWFPRDGYPLADRPPSLLDGLRFSVPLLAILGAHECGHYAVARRYRVNASPPYFIPFPPGLNAVGTLGAFIRVRSPIFDRRTLFDIGAAGPIAGAAVAVPLLALGLSWSAAAPLDASSLAPTGQFIQLGTERIFLGDSLLLLGLRRFAGPEGVLQLHPAAVAGWVGLLLTMLNLLPLAQFDGGHVLFAMIGGAQRWVARAFLLLLVALGWWQWHGWWLWAGLSLALGRGRVTHPSVVAANHPLDVRRQRVGWGVVLLLLLCFMPQPIAG
jgi:membrane-associated protease RseP (regulator of RpoE activity)